MLLAQVSIWHVLTQSGPLPVAVVMVLLFMSMFSWTIIFAKWRLFKKARRNNANFLRAFRKSDGLQSVAMAVEQFPLSPLVSVFEFGYEEVDRQIKTRGTLVNRPALERSLQMGVSEEATKLESKLGFLATTAAISPFIGLFGTVYGIMDAFAALANAGSASLRAVGPGIAEALVTTAIGLAAAIPAAIAYNFFSQQLRQMGNRMEDFTLEFINMTERTFGG